MGRKRRKNENLDKSAEDSKTPRTCSQNITTVAHLESKYKDLAPSKNENNSQKDLQDKHCNKTPLFQNNSCNLPPENETLTNMSTLKKIESDFYQQSQLFAATAFKNPQNLPETQTSPSLLVLPESQIATAENEQDIDSCVMFPEEELLFDQTFVVPLAKSKELPDNYPIYIVSQEQTQTVLQDTSDICLSQDDLPVPIVIQASTQPESTREMSINNILDHSLSILDKSVRMECDIIPLLDNSTSLLNPETLNCEIVSMAENESDMHLNSNDSQSILNIKPAEEPIENEVSLSVDNPNLTISRTNLLECTLQFDQSRCSHLFSGLSANISSIEMELDQGNMVRTYVETAESSHNEQLVIDSIPTNDTTKSVLSVTVDNDYLPVLSSSANTTVGAGEQNVQVGRPKRGRKRKHPQQNRMEKKAKRNKGKEYVNYKGVTVAEKTFVEGFSCNCKKKCTDIIPETKRKIFFQNYWSSGSYESRCALLQGNCKEVEKSRNKSKKRSFTRKYFLNEVPVCKAAFLKTLGISQKPLDIALAKLRKQLPLTDKRGCTGGKNKISETKIEEIKTFIKSLPKYKSHYCCEKSNGKYLAANLNLTLIYDLYKERHPDGVGKSCFKNIFYTKFNLRFKKPQKDTCNRCDIYNVKKKNLVGHDLEETEKEHRIHLDNARSLREQMKKDMKIATQNDEIETLTFDLEKTNCLPRLPTNHPRTPNTNSFHKRQLNLYNFGIHQASNNQGYFNIWLEHEGGRGTQEVGSCLKYFILKNLRDTTKELILWADSCGGQNKSIKLVLLLMHLLSNHDKLEKITMRFLQPGHTFLPNDSEFGDLECALKTHNRLYTDEDYINVMKTCRRKNKFIIYRFSTDDFLSVDPLLKAITNRKKDVDKEKISWPKTFEIEIRKCDPFKLYFKSDITSDSVQIVDIAKQTKRRQAPFKDIVLPILYPNGRPLSEAKIKDLKDMQNLIPEDAKTFYNFLENISTVNFEDDIDGFGEGIDFDMINEDK